MYYEFKSLNESGLKVEYDFRSDVLRVQGICYGGDFFRNLSHYLEPGVAFEVVKREDGVLYIRKVRNGTD